MARFIKRCREAAFQQQACISVDYISNGEIYHGFYWFLLSDDYWAKVSRDIVARGAGLKFAQNPVVRDELLSTGAAMLVECAPRDTR